MTRSIPSARLALATAFAAACLAVAPAARAEDPSAADVVLARQLGNEGNELAQQGKCDQALVKLRRAEQLHHAPTLLLKIGECEIKLGQLVSALSSLDRVSRENLGPSPPKAFVAAQERATTLLAELRPKLGSLRVDTTGSREGATFTLDGSPLNDAALGLDRPVDPGNHVVEATLADGTKVRRELAVTAGGSGKVSLDLPAVAPKAAVTETTKSGGNGLRTLGWGLVIGGGAALAVGGVLTAVTLSTKSDLDAACLDKVCPPSARGDYDSARSSATGAGIAFGIGVVAVATGVVLIVTRKSETRTGAVPAWVTVAATGRYEF